MNKPKYLIPTLLGICLCALSLALLMRPGMAAEKADPAAKEALALGVSMQRYDSAEVVKYPWGWIRWLMNAKVDPKAEMTVGIVQIEPNQSNPYHKHPNCTEYVHVLSGSCEQLVDDKWVPLKAGDIMRFPKGVPHMARTGSEPCRSMIIYDTGNREMVPLERKK